MVRYRTTDAAARSDVMEKQRELELGAAAGYAQSQLHDIIREDEQAPETPAPPTSVLPMTQEQPLSEVTLPSLPVGIYGVSGRVTRALAGLLWKHPEVALTTVASRDHAGEIFVMLSGGVPSMAVLSPDDFPISSLSLVFLCASDDGAEQVLQRCLAQGVKVIDLSHHIAPDIADDDAADELLQAWWETTIEAEVAFGLTELFREDLNGARIVSTPGGFSTCAGLALGPLAQVGQLENHTVVRDSTGAHMRSEDAEFPHLGPAMSHEASAEYKIQVAEAVQALQVMGADESKLVFTSSGGRQSRGLRLAFLTQVDALTPSEIRELYAVQYAPDRFVEVLPPGHKAQAADVIGTNLATISIHPVREREIMILSAIDTLYKGAAGQAIQNMNEMLGLAEVTGLRDVT